jgi:putative restriction endonuclease
MDEVTAKSRHWWVNHSQTFREEIDGGYLWSLKQTKNPANYESYNNMTRLTPGDVVYSFADEAIRAIGVVLGHVREVPKPAAFAVAVGQGGQSIGRHVSVRFREIGTPLHPRDHVSELVPVLPKKRSPIRVDGDAHSGWYLSAVPEAMAAVLRRLLGSQAEVAEREIVESLGSDFLDDVEEERIQQRPDLGTLEKETLIQARRGHGRYRQTLEGVETGCRVTGLIDRRHLRARHIKPWNESNDQEKLDPNNGLLLSPHVDHLFDRGYISFTDQGEMLVSKSLNPVVFEAWGLSVPSRMKPLNAKQCGYLAYHRAEVFEKHGRGKQGEDA